MVTYALTFPETRQNFALGTWCFTGYAALVSFLLATLDWQRVTTPAAYASMIVTAAVWFSLFAASNYGADRKYTVGGVLPVATVFASCAITVVLVPLFTSPPSASTLAKFFPQKSNTS